MEMMMEMRGEILEEKMLNNKKYNFCAGPAVISDEVLKEAQQAIIDYDNSGMSILSISHRSQLFIDLMHKAKSSVRELLSVPDNYEIAFIAGGATEQFSDVPKNLAQAEDHADYSVIGHWGKVAVKYAKEFVNVREVSSVNNKIDLDWNLNKDSKYLHITNNETVNGIEFFDISPINQKIKDMGSDMFIVSDMSSCIFSRPIDISQYGVIYACAQKNFGPSGLSLVIIRKDLLNLARSPIEKTRNYKAVISKDSILNTPNTFGVYLASRVFEWIKRCGGVEFFAKENARKAALLYDAIDSSDIYINNIPKEYRSHMNIVFEIKNKSDNKLDKNLEKLFIEQANQNNLFNLAGHASQGGIRASLYNAMSYEGVCALVKFMKDFENKI